MFRIGLWRGILLCFLVLSPAACKTQRTTTVTPVYAPNARPLQLPVQKPTKIKIPLTVRITTFVVAPFSKLFSLLPHKKKLPAAKPPPWVGTVRLVNKADKFVLIDGISLSAAQPGDTLIALSDQSESATLRMSALTDPPFVIADIIDGKPGVGDKVYAPKKNLHQ